MSKLPHRALGNPSPYKKYNETDIIIMAGDIVMTKFSDKKYRLVHFHVGSRKGACGIIGIDEYSGLDDYPLNELRFVTRHEDALEDPEEILP
jgi:hypothetical protein